MANKGNAVFSGGGVVKRRFNQVLTFGASTSEFGLYSSTASVSDSKFNRDYTVLLFPASFGSDANNKIDENDNLIRLTTYGAPVAFIIENNTEIKAVSNRSHSGFTVDIEFLEFAKNSLVRPVEHSHEIQSNPATNNSNVGVMVRTFINTVTDISKTRHFPCIGGGGHTLAPAGHALKFMRVPTKPISTTQEEWKFQPSNSNQVISGNFLPSQIVEFKK